MSTIIVKKVKKAHHGHHGGAWKIAYADFVTAMMAFFLLMWLISMTTQEQKVGLAEFFAPSTLAFSNKGAAGPLGGKTLDDSSNKSSTLNDIESGSPERGESARPSKQSRTNNLDTSNSDASAQANLSAMASLQQALQTLPDIAELSHNISIKPTKDGVNVSLVDENGRAMFRDGSAQPYEHTRRILDAIAPALRKLPNRLLIAGHTSASRPGSAPTEEPWSLTTKRALAFRDILSGAGVPADHFASVEGRADTEPVLRDAPYIAPNRRVTITLLNASSPVPTDLLRLK